MSVGLYTWAGGTKAYVKDGPTTRSLEFSENPRDAVLFATQAAAAAFIAARPATTIPILGQTGTAALTLHGEKSRGDKSE